MTISVFDLPDQEIELTAIRASGPGGQHVNKVSTAVHLRFDINTSSLPHDVKQKMKHLPDRRISQDGVVVIKSQQSRSREKNREQALLRLDELIQKAQVKYKKRVATRPTRASVRRRLDSKTRRSSIKKTRGKPGPD